MKHKDSRYYRLIQSPRWQQLRARKLNARPLCEDCLASGIYTAATEVHHIQPAETAVSDAELERLMFDWSNLRSLCHDCHVIEHRSMHSHSAAAEKDRQHSRTERFVRRFFDNPSTPEPGALFFIEPPFAPNPLPKSREKFLVSENPVGEPVPVGAVRPAALEQSL